MKRLRYFAAPAGLACLLLGGVSADAQPSRVDALIAEMRTAYASVTEYTATFVKRERLGGALGNQEVIALKFRKPKSIYMRWTSGRAVGREVLLVQGRDQDRALIHEASGLRWWLTVVIAPDHPRVLQESRHPITDAGLGRLIELVRQGVGSTTTVTWKELPAPAGSDLGGVTRQIEFTSPRPVETCSCRRAIVTVDAATHLPAGADTFDERDALVGSYTYVQINLNPRLTDADFDPSNPSYRFPALRWTVR